MSYACKDLVSIAQYLFQSFGFCRGFDNYKDLPLILLEILFAVLF